MLLLNILVMGVVSVAAAAVLARGSLDSYLDSATAFSAWNARADVFGCLDEALIQIKKNNDFLSETIFTGDATCTLMVTTPDVGQRSIIVSSTENNITRQVTVLVTLSPFTVNQVTEP